MGVIDIVDVQLESLLSDDNDITSEKPSDPIVQSIDINPTPTSYAGATGASTIGQSKVNSEADLVDVVTIGIPSLTREDLTKETIHVEYEWRPPKCDVCNIFGHVHDQCPKKVVSPSIVTISTVVTPTVEMPNDGFQMVGKKKKKGKHKSTNGNVTTSNSYSALENYKDEDEEHVENLYDESANLFPKSRVGERSSFTAGAG
nr:hypothetical protein [Tanacetum cinerariifolium]